MGCTGSSLVGIDLENETGSEFEHVTKISRHVFSLSVKYTRCTLKSGKSESHAGLILFLNGTCTLVYNGE